MSNKVLCIDFDGPIHKASQGNKDRVIYDVPTEGAVFTLNNLAKAGYKLIVLTSRPSEDWEQVQQWMNEHGFPPVEVTNVKPPALAYIDDRGVRFDSWINVCHYFI